jgi:LysR family hydrogen peroxide-inducible transcriptional activator
MNLTALKYIVSLAKEKHFGHAAQACGVTQPTLSIAVKNLEQELGVQLFERSPMNVRVTSSGLPIVRHAHAVMQEVQAIEEIARNSRKPHTGLLRLGLVHHLSPRLMPALVRGMRTLAPEMPVISHEGLIATLSEQLRDGAIDCALMDTLVADSELQSAPLFDEDLYVAVGPKHPWAQLQNIDLPALQQETLLLPSLGQGLLDALIHGNPELASLKTRKSGLVQEVKGASMEALAHMVLAGMGVAILPRWPSPGATSAHPQDITCLTLSGSHLTRRVALVWRANSKRKTDLELLLQVLQDFQ